MRRTLSADSGQTGVNEEWTSGGVNNGGEIREQSNGELLQLRDVVRWGIFYFGPSLRRTAMDVGQTGYTPRRNRGRRPRIWVTHERKEHRR